MVIFQIEPEKAVQKRNLSDVTEYLSLLHEHGHQYSYRIIALTPIN